MTENEQKSKEVSNLPPNAQKWVDALRSGDYSQERALLHIERAGFCCLGVACDISKLGQWQSEGYVTANEAVHWDILPNVVADWLGLADGVGTFKVAQEINGRTAKNLTDLNDLVGFNFNQIADFIENNWELLKR